MREMESLEEQAAMEEMDTDTLPRKIETRMIPQQGTVREKKRRQELNSETTVAYTGGQEEWQYAWDLAGERYAPVCQHSVKFRTTWTLTDLLADAEHKGVKITTLLSKRNGRGGHLTSMVADLEHEDRTALAVLTSENHVTLFAADARVNAAFMKILLDGMPAPAPLPQPVNAIYVSFSYDTDDGNRAVTRAITAPSWEVIKANYPEQVRGKLDEFITGGPDALRGHLGILHGPPGSGKSTFIRSLCKEWTGKARVTYIVDTETFFTNPGYLLSTILDDRSGWHIIICEDAEDFLTREKKAQVGQAISRILNVGDGMLGQGLRVLILFTTNAKRMDLDDAITRKGRCFLDVELPRFTRSEAITWLLAHGRTNLQAGEDTMSKEPRDWSLAELYDITGVVPDTEVVMSQPDPLEDWESSLLAEDF